MEFNSQRHYPHLLLLLTPRLMPRQQYDRLHQPKRNLLTRRSTRLHKQLRHHVATRRSRPRRIHSLLNLHTCCLPPRRLPLQRRNRRHSGSRRRRPRSRLRFILVRRPPPHPQELIGRWFSNLRCSGELGKQHQSTFYGWWPCICGKTTKLWSW